MPVSNSQLAVPCWYLQSTESQYVGNWENGGFVDGTWALQDGSAYNGRFGNNVGHQLYLASVGRQVNSMHLDCSDILFEQINLFT